MKHHEEVFPRGGAILIAGALTLVSLPVANADDGQAAADQTAAMIAAAAAPATLVAPDASTLTARLRPIRRRP